MELTWTSLWDQIWMIQEMWFWCAMISILTKMQQVVFPIHCTWAETRQYPDNPNKYMVWGCNPLYQFITGGFTHDVEFRTEGESMVKPPAGDHFDKVEGASEELRELSADGKSDSEVLLGRGSWSLRENQLLFPMMNNLTYSLTTNMVILPQKLFWWMEWIWTIWPWLLSDRVVWDWWIFTFSGNIFKTLWRFNSYTVSGI